MLTAINPRAYSQAFGGLIGLLGKHRQLTWEMTRRDIKSQYAGQLFGTLWAVGHPLFLMGLFVFVFGFVFKQKIGGTHELPLDYTTYLLAGLVPWLAFQQTMARACTALTGEANLVKQVVFPIEVLPVKIVIASFLPEAVGLVVLIGYVLVLYGSLPPTYFLLPVVLALQALAMLGVAMMLSATGVFLRDLKDLVQLFAAAGIYLMPVVYLPQWVPGPFKPILYLNPFSYMAWCFQDVLYFGRVEHPFAWLVFGLGSLFVFVSGYRVFRKLKPQLGNVL